MRMEDWYNYGYYSAQRCNQLEWNTTMMEGLVIMVEEMCKGLGGLGSGVMDAGTRLSPLAADSHTFGVYTWQTLEWSTATRQETQASGVAQAGRPRLLAEPRVLVIELTESEAARPPPEPPPLPIPPEPPPGEAGDNISLRTHGAATLNRTGPMHGGKERSGQYIFTWLGRCARGEESHSTSLGSEGDVERTVQCERGWSVAGPPPITGLGRLLQLYTYFACSPAMCDTRFTWAVFRLRE